MDVLEFFELEVLKYFDLKEQPFRIGPDPRFLYLPDQVQETLAKCEYMARERIGPLHISGPVGGDIPTRSAARAALIARIESTPKI